MRVYPVEQIGKGFGRLRESLADHTFFLLKSAAPPFGRRSRPEVEKGDDTLGTVY